MMITNTAAFTFREDEMVVDDFQEIEALAELGVSAGAFAEIGASGSHRLFPASVVAVT